MNQQSAGAVWKKTVNTKNGPVEVLSITIDGKRYTAWPNTFKKEGEKSPDYRLQLDNYEPKQQQSANNPLLQDGKQDVPILPAQQPIQDDLPF